MSSSKKSLMDWMHSFEHNSKSRMGDEEGIVLSRFCTTYFTSDHTLLFSTLTWLAAMKYGVSELQQSIVLANTNISH